MHLNCIIGVPAVGVSAGEVAELPLSAPELPPLEPKLVPAGFWPELSLPATGLGVAGMREKNKGMVRRRRERWKGSFISELVAEVRGDGQVWGGWDRGIMREKGIYGTAWGGIQGYTTRRYTMLVLEACCQTNLQKYNTRSG